MESNDNITKEYDRMLKEYDRMVKDANDAKQYESLVSRLKICINIAKAGITGCYIAAAGAACGSVASMGKDNGAAVSFGFITLYALASAIG
ncbi:MAG: hypothetical protein WC852_07235, partial [Candidatus Nanoarchaeia archaeon]